ncbi:MAG: dUTP diphosphatase [Beijerinckiaceae bacterium]
MDERVIPVRILPHGEGLPLPRRETVGAAGLDLTAAIGPDEQITLNCGDRLLVPTGIALQLPAAYEAQVRPRSGLALRHGITVLNAPGTIDADYRGEINVLLVNFGREPFTVTRGLRIAQLVVAPVTAVRLEPVVALNDTDRGAGGFGSTGSKVAGSTKAEGP